MAVVRPEIIIRLGSHSEKEYVKTTGRLLDGIIVGANLFEATPGATASLLSKCAGAKMKLRYFIDPMTYAFGSYVDPTTRALRSDLDWIKSEKKRNKKKERTF